MFPKIYRTIIKNALPQSIFVFAFLLTLVVPFIKTFFLGEIDNSLQRQFIIYFFAVQFITPIINFGLGWANIRKFIERDQEGAFKLAKPTILLILLLPLFLSLIHI